MMKRLLLVVLVSLPASAATFIVPPDSTMITVSKAIVVATAGDSQARWAPGGWIETVTTMHADEVIKGRVGATFEVVELGGTIDGITYLVAGAPRYPRGERVLLMLETNDRGEWAAKNMAVGKFAFAGDLLLRDASPAGTSTARRTWRRRGWPSRSCATCGRSRGERQHPRITSCKT